MSDNFASIEIPNAKFIFYTNFKGQAGPYNDEGDRNFNVVLEGDALRKAEEYGMNVKHTKPNADGETLAYVKVKIGYKFKAPIVMLINSQCKRQLNESNVGLVDDYEFDHIDMVIRPNRWRRQDGSSGVNAYLQEFYGVVQESSFASKYNTLEESNGDTPF